MKKFFLLISAVLLVLPVFAGDVAAYLDAGYMNLDDVKVKLTGAGYTILSEKAVDKQSMYKVVVFTNNDLLKLGAKEDRGFASLMRVLVNDKDKALRVINPYYFQKAFLQKEYSADVAKKLYDSFVSLFGELKPTKDILDEDDLAGYHFMFSMPYYEDFLVVGEGKTAELISKLEAKAGKNILFKQKLNDDSYIFGVMLSDTVRAFLNTLKTEKYSLILPYTIVIEKGKAKILHAKYYFAISLPLLKMGQFMDISEIPGVIEDEFTSFFK